MHDTDYGRRAVIAGIGAATFISGVPIVTQAAQSFVHRMQIGDVTVTAISDGHFDLPGAAFSNTGDVTLGETVRAGATLWAIQTPGRTLLVDAGSGPFLQQRYPATGQMPDHLDAAGIDPAAVSDIVITHMHADHIGGLLRDGQPRFPNAALHLQEAEWDYWTAPERPSLVPDAQKPLAGLIQSIAGQISNARTLHRGETDLGGGVSLMPAPGHTPGHQAVRITSGDATLLLLGDALIASPLHIEHPEVAYMLESDPDEAAETRRALFNMIAADDVPFCATHMNGLSPSRLTRSGEGYSLAAS